MPEKKMHIDELEISETLVKDLLSSQFPHWAQLPLKRVKSDGTDNAIFRLGADMSVRLPRVAWAADDASKEQKWLPILSSALLLAIPVPLGKGIPEANYPWHWSVCPWFTGENAGLVHIDSSHEAATALANFLIALWRIDSSGGPPSRRGLPLQTQDKEVRQAIASLHGKIDTNKATALWEECLEAPAWEKPPVWLHGDLLPGNLLVQDGKLSAVIDWGLAGIGDPACDLIAAWSVFSLKTRQIFRTTLAADEALWARGRGWALSIALIILPYYWDTNPGLVAVARRILGELFDEA